LRTFAQVAEVDQDVDIAAGHGDRKESNPGALASFVAPLVFAVAIKSIRIVAASSMPSHPYHSHES
jgi:hypothetical protein